MVESLRTKIAPIAAKEPLAIASTANRTVRARAFLICRTRTASSCGRNSMITSVVMPQSVYRDLPQTQPNQGKKSAHQYAAGPSSSSKLPFLLRTPPPQEPAVLLGGTP